MNRSDLEYAGSIEPLKSKLYYDERSEEFMDQAPVHWLGCRRNNKCCTAATPGDIVQEQASY
jgi:hypothetical protein